MSGSLEAGARLHTYEIVAPLGAGGMGEVYLARDTRLDRPVALKLLPSRMSQDPLAIGSFRREALTLAALNHPNIAIIHGFEELADGTTVLVMERVEGETLAARLAHGPMSIEEALQICAQVAEALEVAHSHGIVHRDVKPGNVMIGRRGLVKVLDFDWRAARGLDRIAAQPRAAPGAGGRRRAHGRDGDSGLGFLRRHHPRHARLHEPRAGARSTR
jgi:serine/threonine protein kinase